MNLLDCLQRASLFGVAALGVALFLQWILTNRVPASWRVWVWRAALIQTAFALVPLAPIALAVLPARAPIVAPKSVEAPMLETPIAPAIETPQSAEVAPAEISPPAIAEAPAVIERAAPQPAAKPFELPWRALLAWVYGFGIAVQLALLARNAWRVRQIVRACTPLDDARLGAIAARFGVKRAPRLLRSASGAPFLVGLRRPTIVLPQTLADDHREAVLAHEMAHHKRRDLRWNLLLWGLQTLLWFHPLSWLARRYHALEIESACDELTLKLTPIAPKSYGALLLNSASVPTSPLTAGVNDGFFALQTRLARLGRAPMQPRRRVRVLFVAALLVSFAAIVPFELTARAQNAVELIEKSAIGPVTGLVVDPNGAALSGALIGVEGLDVPGDIGVRGTVRADENGRFVVPAALIGSSAQLFGRWNERSSAHGTIVRSGDEVKLVLNSHVLATISGRINKTDTLLFLPDIGVELYRKIDGGEVKVASTKSDARGAFRFAELRPFQNYFMRFQSEDYYRLGEIIDIENVHSIKYGVRLEETTSKLRGRLLKADGTPAAGWGVSVATYLGPVRNVAEVRTRSDGKFFFDHLLKGQVLLKLREPNAQKARFTKSVATGDPNVIEVRADENSRKVSNDLDKEFGPPTKNLSLDPASLIGKIAPALRVRPESDSPSLQSLRGQTVLLCFGRYRNLSPVVGNFAVSYQERGVRVLCVEDLPFYIDSVTFTDGKAAYTGLNSPQEAVKTELRQIRFAKEYDDLPIDVAFDSSRASDTQSPIYDGQTAALYGGAKYVVIGRDGVIIYAGDKIDLAIESVSTE